jgi:hypothetical protein
LVASLAVVLERGASLKIIIRSSNNCVGAMPVIIVGKSYVCGASATAAIRPGSIGNVEDNLLLHGRNAVHKGGGDR